MFNTNKTSKMVTLNFLVSCGYMGGFPRFIEVSENATAQEVKSLIQAQLQLKEEIKLYHDGSEAKFENAGEFAKLGNVLEAVSRDKVMQYRATYLATTLNNHLASVSENPELLRIVAEELKPNTLNAISELAKYQKSLSTTPFWPQTQTFQK